MVLALCYIDGPWHSWSGLCELYFKFDCLHKRCHLLKLHSRNSGCNFFAWQKNFQRYWLISEIRRSISSYDHARVVGLWGNDFDGRLSRSWIVSSSNSFNEYNCDNVHDGYGIPNGSLCLYWLVNWKKRYKKSKTILPCFKSRCFYFNFSLCSMSYCLQGIHHWNFHKYRVR